MLLVDVERGKIEGAAMASDLGGKNHDGSPPGNDDGTIRLIDGEEDEMPASDS